LFFTKGFDEMLQAVEEYTIGDVVVCRVTGELISYVAEIISTSPLHLKIEESGPFSKLKPGDYIIDYNLTELYNHVNSDESTREQEQEFLNALPKSGLASGLTSVFGEPVEGIQRINWG
jgi:hypothetical protein